MKSSFLKILMVLVWFATANHCFVSFALSAPVSNLAKHHCCGHEEKEKQPQGTHKGCDKAGCCQPVIQSGSGAEAIPPSLEFSIPSFFLNVTAKVPLVEQNLFSLSPNCIGPPDPSNGRLSSLSVAQNAPPIRS